MEFTAFFVLVVRRMVSRDNVNRSVTKSLDAGESVRFLAQGRIHAAAAVIAHDPLIRRADVMRRRFRSHADAARLRLADQLHAAFGRNMAEMNTLAFHFRNENVARNHDLLGGTGGSRQTELSGNKAFIHHAVADKVLILAVAHDEQPKMVGILHRQTEKVRVRYRLSVVGNRDDTRFLHPADFRHFNARQPLGDRADRIDAHAASLRLRLFDDVARHSRVVIGRLRVGHAANRGKAAVRRRARTGNDILFVFLTRVAQMAVHVDKARGNHLARRIVYLCAVGGKLFANRRDFAVLNQNIRDFIHSIGGVYDVSAANQKLFHHPFSLLVSK